MSDVFVWHGYTICCGCQGEMPPTKEDIRLCSDCEDTPQTWLSDVPLKAFRVGDSGSYMGDFINKAKQETSATVFRVAISQELSKAMAVQLKVGSKLYGMTNKYFVCVGESDAYSFGTYKKTFLETHDDSDYLYTIVWEGGK